MTFSPFLRKILLIGIAAAAVNAAAQTQGAVVLTAGNAQYVGFYSMADHALSVTLEGTLYRGHFAQRTGMIGATDEQAAASSGRGPNGRWGRAFLFASSAQVLQCELDSGFPAASGHCTDTKGRYFQLKANTLSGNAP